MSTYEVSGDGRQVFVRGGGLVCDCAAQWHDDGDEEGAITDEHRGKSYAIEICKALNRAANGNTIDCHECRALLAEMDECAALVRAMLTVADILKERGVVVRRLGASPMVYHTVPEFRSAFEELERVYEHCRDEGFEWAQHEGDRP